MTEPGHTLHDVLRCAGLNHRTWENIPACDRACLANAEEGMRHAFLRDLRARGIIDDERLDMFVGAETWRREMVDDPSNSIAG